MRERLQKLENNVAELKSLKRSYSISEIKNDRKKEWALRYGLLESIQIVIDISCHLVVKHNLGNAETYADCITLLHQYDYIDESLENSLKAMTGLRNILVHEYVAIDLDQLYSMLDHLSDFTKFASDMDEHFS